MVTLLCPQVIALYLLILPMPSIDSSLPCPLPSMRRFLEECEHLGNSNSGIITFDWLTVNTGISLDRYHTVPKPLNGPMDAFGVHPVVCCPPDTEQDFVFISETGNTGGNSSDKSAAVQPTVYLL